MYSDSLDKVLGTYLAAITTHPFTYNLGKKNVDVEPRPLHVSPLLLRGFTCPPLCGGCCPRFTLDYLPYEDHPYPLTKRTIKVSFPAIYSGPMVTIINPSDTFDYDIEIWSDLQEKNLHIDSPKTRLTLVPVGRELNRDTQHFCNNLNLEDGRCGIHGRQPFSCDFELIRFTKFQDHWGINERLFGRGWSFQTVTQDERGAKCTITDADIETAKDVARRLARLSQWANHFGLRNHRGPELVDYCLTYADKPDQAPRIVL